MALPAILINWRFCGMTPPCNTTTNGWGPVKFSQFANDGGLSSYGI